MTRPQRYKQAAQWKTVGGAPALVDVESGSILEACPGLEDEDLDDISGGESQESRERRRVKQQKAEARGYVPRETRDAKKAWQDAQQEAPEGALVMVKVGDKYYSFGQDADTLQELLGVGDGEVADFKEGALEQYLTELTEAGQRIAIAERTDEGDARPVRVEDPGDDDAPDAREDAVSSKDRRLPTAEQPAELTKSGHQFRVMFEGGQWFYENSPGAGWVSASDATSEWIERELYGGPDGTSQDTEAGKPEKTDRLTEGVMGALESVGIPVDKESVKGFRDLVLEVWDRKRKAAEEENHAVRDLLGQFGVGAKSLGGFLSAIQRARDYDGIKRWDEIAEMATRDFPQLLASLGSYAGDDPEQALFERLQQGMVEVPAKWSDEVIDEAIGYVESSMGTRRETAVPFARSLSRGDWVRIRYAAKRGI